MSNPCKKFPCECCDRFATKAEMFDEMREALTKVLMVALLPNDVSGCRMVQDARDTLAKANNIAEKSS